MANMPEARAMGKSTVSPMGSMAEVEQATAGATQPPPQRAEGTSESGEGRLVLADMVAAPLPLPPPPPRVRDVVRKLLLPRSRATEVAAKQARDEALAPCEAVALEAGDAEAPSIAEATEGETGAPRTPEAKVAETGVSRTTESEVAEAGASRATKAEVAAASSGTAEPLAQDVDTKAGQALDQLRQQKDLLANANGLLPARSVEVEDLRLRCADIKAKAATAREQAAPLAAWIKELEEGLTWAAGERDTFRSRAEQEAASAKAVTGQLEVEKGAHLLTKGALEEAVKVAESSRVDALA
ncbi:uncharacterized protein [Miscanthus floridulus]|uniref:uncharacterized protein n=1 Tax=Miscanthus floridulus TaxID=154761 RepID=UPI00345A8AE6